MSKLKSIPRPSCFECYWHQQIHNCCKTEVAARWCLCENNSRLLQEWKRVYRKPNKICRHWLSEEGQDIKDYLATGIFSDDFTRLKILKLAQIVLIQAGEIDKLEVEIGELQKPKVNLAKPPLLFTR